MYIAMTVNLLTEHNKLNNRYKKASISRPFLFSSPTFQYSHFPHFHTFTLFYTPLNLHTSTMTSGKFGNIPFSNWQSLVSFHHYILSIADA
jgi:hypothetical protein